MRAFILAVALAGATPPALAQATDGAVLDDTEGSALEPGFDSAPLDQPGASPPQNDYPGMDQGALQQPGLDQAPLDNTGTDQSGATGGQARDDYGASDFDQNQDLDTGNQFLDSSADQAQSDGNDQDDAISTAANADTDIQDVDKVSDETAAAYGGAGNLAVRQRNYLVSEVNSMQQRITSLESRLQYMTQLLQRQQALLERQRAELNAQPRRSTNPGATGQRREGASTGGEGQSQP